MKPRQIILTCVLSILIFNILSSIVLAEPASNKIEQELFPRNNLVTKQTYVMFATVWSMFEKSASFTPNGQSFGMGEPLARLLTGMCYTWLADYEITGDIKQVTRVNWLLSTITLPKYHKKYAYHWSSMWISGSIAYMRLTADDILTDETKKNIDNMLIAECDMMVKVLDHIEEEPLALVDMKYWMSYGGHKDKVKKQRRISLLGSTDNSWMSDTKAEETAGRARLLAICGNLYNRDDYINAARLFASVTFAHKKDVFGVTITNVSPDFTVYNHGYGPNYAYAVAALYGLAETHFSFIVMNKPVPSECQYQQYTNIYTQNVINVLMPDGCHVDLSLLRGNQKNIEYEHRPDIKWLSGDTRYSLAVLPYDMLINDISSCSMKKIVACLSNDLTWMPYSTELLLEQIDDGRSCLAVNHMIHNVEHYSQITYKWIVIQKMIQRETLLNKLDGWLRKWITKY